MELPEEVDEDYDNDQFEQEAYNHAPKEIEQSTPVEALESRFKVSMQVDKGEESPSSGMNDPIQEFY